MNDSSPDTVLRDFQLYLRDRRYSVPTLRFVSAPNVARARTMALQLLSESNHYEAVEVYEADRLLFAVDPTDLETP